MLISPLQSINFYTAYRIAKTLVKKNYEVRLTANDGIYVYLQDNVPVVRLSDGSFSEYRFSFNDMKGKSNWCIAWRKKNKANWSGFAECLKLPCIASIAEDIEEQIDQGLGDDEE